MSLPLLSIKTEVYTSADATYTIKVPSGFRQMTLTTQPLNLTGDITNSFINDLVTEDNAVAATSMAGTVVFTATPPRTFHTYPIPDGSVDLSAPSFVSTTTPIDSVGVSLQGITGSSHVAVTIVSYL